MKIKETYEAESLERKRRRLNEVIVTNGFDLLNKEVIELSRELDVIVIREMYAEDLNTGI